VATAVFTALASITTPAAHLNPAIVNNIAVGSSPQGVGVNPSTNRVYVANGLSDSVSVIDGATEAVVATIGVGDQPVGVAVNSTTLRIYVANLGSDSVSVIDGETNTVTATIAVGDQPLGVGVNRDTNRIYVSNLASHDVSVIDGATETVVATIPVGLNPYGIAVNAVTNRVYVANFGSDTVSVIDGADNTQLTTIPTAHWPTGVGVNATTNRIYVSSWILYAPLNVIDGATNSVIATIVPGGYCHHRALGIAVDEANDVVHVAYRCGGGSGGKLVSIDASTNTVRSDLFICCLGAPLYVDLNPVTDRLYLSLPGWSTKPEDATWVAVVADDLEPPTWPSGSTLSVYRASLTSITLQWTPATDDSGVTRYRVYRDGQLVVTVGNQTSAFIGNLTPDTSYAFKVEACDAFDQCSTDGPAVIGKTQSVVEALADLASTVAYLGGAGVLNVGQAEGLEAKLAAAIRHYEEGRTDQVATLLDAFILEVEAFRQAGVMPTYYADDLIYQASLIRTYVV
jgi:YVTN family beta-propeller protein